MLKLAYEIPNGYAKYRTSPIRRLIYYVTISDYFWVEPILDTILEVLIIRSRSKEL